MDGWSAFLLAAAGFVAVSTLVRLMLTRRNQLLQEARRRRRSGRPVRPSAANRAAPRHESENAA